MLDMLQNDHDPSHNCDGKEGKNAIVRVNDLEQADVFFVPLMSSLSFNTYGHIMFRLEAKIDKLLQVSMLLLLLLLLFFNSLSLCAFVIWKLRKINPSVKLNNINVILVTKKTHATIKLSNIHVISKPKKNMHYYQA